jgi:hypothetical protein
MLFYREVKKTVTRKEVENDIEFEEWYVLYPYQNSKLSAQKAWRILKQDEKEQAKKLLDLHIRLWKSK